MNLGTTPVLAFTIRGTVAHLSLLFVPRPCRGRGLGRALFERWEGGLPKEVTRIEVLSATIDDDSPIGFWTHLGFVPVEGDPATEDLVGCYLHKPRRASPTARQHSSAPANPAA